MEDKEIQQTGNSDVKNHAEMPNDVHSSNDVSITLAEKVPLADDVIITQEEKEPHEKLRSEVTTGDSYAQVTKSLSPDTPTANGLTTNGSALHDQDEKAEEDVKVIKSVGFFELFRYANGFDRFLMIVGIVGAIGMGCAIPCNLLIYGEILDRFISSAIPPNLNVTAMPSTPLGDQIDDLIIYFVIIGIAVLILGYIEISCWVWAAERQSRRIRAMAYRSILKQHIGWFDIHETGELNSRLADDIAKIQTGIGDKFAMCVQWVCSFIAGYVLGFSRGWKLTLVILSVAPVLVIAIGLLQRIMQKITQNEQAAYAKAGSVAEEVLSAIRTVYAFGGEKRECVRYDKNLITAEMAGRKKGFMTGAGVGVVWLLIFSAFALAFWYGTKLVIDRELTGGDVLQVFFGVLMGTMSLGQAAPNLEFIASARGAAAAIFELIEMESEIDSSSPDGEKPQITGNVEIKDVEFNYPARPEIQILRGFSLKVDVGKTVALVGQSGCGKSTIIQLIQRFYDPLKGMVKVDGHDIRTVNIKWLREHIGVVSQEPVLFAETIAENIRYGRDGVSQAEIEQAAREANAYDFICKLPDKFETLVGERGSQLSGGQKQRIAIARALVRNPKVLLLDEATSALDTESESVVQAALDKARVGRTTIVIAHRLSTIRNADLIVAVEDGRVVETGSHHELMKLQGLYYGLVMSQTAAAKKEEKAAEDPLDEFDEVLKNTESPLQLARSLSSQRSTIRSKTRSMSINSVNSLTSSMRKKSGLSRHLSVTSQLSDSWSVKDENALAKKLPPATLTRIMKMNAPEWPFIVIGCIAAIFTGSVTPSFSIIFSEILGNFAETDPDKQSRQSSMYAGILFAMGVVVGTAQLCQAYFFTRAGEALTKRLRSMAFSSMLRQEVGWFDNRENQVGALTARLASDASLVRGAAGQQIGTVIQSFCNIGVAIIIAFVFGWKLAFVVIAFLPAMIASGIAQGTLMQGFGKKDQKAVEEGGKIAVETIDNIRTVVALTKEDYFFNKYDDHFEDMYRKGIKKAQVYGIFYSFGQSVIFFAYAAAFSYGADLIDSGEIEFQNVFRVFGALTFGGQALGRAFTFAPDLGKAKLAAAKLFVLFDKKSEIDSSDPTGAQPTGCSGNVTFSGVKFRYPARPDMKVLQGLDLSVKTGETLALVGASGCGKSTTVQLLERFYDPQHGHVKLDGFDTRDLNIQWMRQQMGIVSQEPMLFDASIKDNIAYGDNSRDVAMAEIIAAARKANIHNFIENLPQGYETNVGDRGTQLSGGQKQRIAIARALIRNPRVLLLDEATSALDTESEKIVQEALDQARVGRTSIVIAHRLSTIQNSNVIAVIHNGKVVEQGSHHELMAKQCYYYRLQKAQNRGDDEEDMYEI